jgi:hypothetical protein
VAGETPAFSAISLIVKDFFFFIRSARLPSSARHSPIWPLQASPARLTRFGSARMTGWIPLHCVSYSEICATLLRKHGDKTLFV